MFRRLAYALVFFALFQCLYAAPVRAGTTGALVGRVVDAATKLPLAGATITAVSPSQSATTKSDAGGSFRFLTLAPDTYVIGVERPGYDAVSVSGVTVVADQSQTLPIALAKTLRTIGAVTSRAANELIKPGTTSDVYSVNAAGAEAAQTLGGPGGLNSAYSAIASVPGVNVQQGQQGWFQTVSIRGGDIDQVGYELDGLPVNRVYDNAPQTVLSNIGQQELQVYTGGTPASADASGIAGYVNQVIRTGTYPGFVTANVGVGGPAFYHKLSFEFGGASSNRLFSYYVGLAGVNQDYRYVDQFNGVSDPQLFYPVSLPSSSRFNVYDGSGPGGAWRVGPGVTYGISNTTDRENVVNLHFGIPHHNDGGKDDVQLLYLTSEIVESYFSSVNDLGGPGNVVNAVGNGGNAFWHDGYNYGGPLFAPVDPAAIQADYFPNSPQARAFEANSSNNLRDYSDNGVAIAKIQYQRNFDAKSYLRIYGYTEYSNWFIGGPANQQFTNSYGGELNDYELPSHTFGFNANYSNQLSDKHLLSLTGSYTAAELQRRYTYGWPGNSIGAPISNLVGPGGLCYDPTKRLQTSCFGGARGTLPDYAPGQPADPNYSLPTGSVAVTTPGGQAATATWLATDNGLGTTPLNRVAPAFTAAAVTDQWRPNDRTTVTIGARLEDYDDRLADTSGGAARAFWFAAYDNETCFKLGVTSVQSYGPGATNANCAAKFGPGYQQANLQNAQASNVTATIFEPRFGATYSLDPDTVLRGSFGVYARAVNTSWLQYNSVNSNLASFIGNNFMSLGYNTPIHDLRPDTSYNADFSLEKHLHGTDLSFKLTPFYRATKNQLQPVPIGAGGVVSGFNVGQQTSTGVEFALKKGDFARDGFSGQLAYTYTHSRITYKNFPSGTNVIDTLNQYVSEYNSYTSACAKVTAANAALCGLTPGATNPNAAPSFAAVDPNGAPTTIANPYYNQPAQPLFDRNGSYTTYDQIPQPFTGENGYETPNVASLILNYKHKQITLTPSLTYSSGAKYGSPLAYPGYIPSACATVGAVGTAGSTVVNPASCAGSSKSAGLPFLLIPDTFTGRFDTLGAFDEPQRITVNFAASYQASKNVKLTLALTGLVDACIQRGYAWDDKNVCVYSQLPSGGNAFGPSGNFIPLANTPIQFKYPYGVFNNNLNTGFVGTPIPFDASFNVQIKL